MQWKLELYEINTSSTVQLESSEFLPTFLPIRVLVTLQQSATTFWMPGQDLTSPKLKNLISPQTVSRCLKEPCAKPLKPVGDEADAEGSKEEKEACLEKTKQKTNKEKTKKGGTA